MNLLQLKSLFVKVGARKLYAKPLAENDNSKNQVYFGPDFQALNLFPNNGIVADSSKKNAIFKAKLSFGWLLPNEKIAEAPNAQFILYPQYPEVRFSGFLQGCDEPPSALMAGRLSGRVLFLGATGDDRIVGFVVGQDSEVAAELRAESAPKIGVFTELSLPTIPNVFDARAKLLEELGRIHRMEWIPSRQLHSNGKFAPCNAPQCGGFTLEAELGIPKNSKSEPDFLGWEVKQYAVDDFKRIESSKPITLMTPEPDGGFYYENTVETFVRKFGYDDKMGRIDRMNFGGRHFVGLPCAATGLTLKLRGYDTEKEKIVDADGALDLMNAEGDIAAAWSFKKILEHWSHKHASAVYVPSNCRTEPKREYRYGHTVRLAQKTDPLRLLKAFASGSVYYDPGIKLENCSTAKPSTKTRSQFRVGSKNINALYESVETVAV